MDFPPRGSGTDKNHVRPYPFHLALDVVHPAKYEDLTTVKTKQVRQRATFGDGFAAVSAGPSSLGVLFLKCNSACGQALAHTVAQAVAGAQGFAKDKDQSEWRWFRR